MPLFLKLGLGPLLRHNPMLPIDAIDVEYLAENLWLVGSPATVADRIAELQHRTEGFGHLPITSYDAADERGARA